MPDPGDAMDASVCVLLVDEDVLLLKAIRRVLHPMRRPVLTADNVDSAEAILSAHPVGVVVCEPHDPAIAGFLIGIRARHPNVVRVILTGYPDMATVLRAVNEANPFKMLIKPWIDEELVATVGLACEQYALNCKRDRLIGEYASIRANAERSHAFHMLDALKLSAHADMNVEAIRDLPVGALLLKDGVAIQVNPAAQRFFAGAGLAVAPPDMLAAALSAPRRQRMHHVLADGNRIDYFVLDLVTGVLVAFAPAPDTRHY